MALTTLDPNTALIIVDLQKGIVGLPVIHPMRLIARARALADAFRGHACRSCSSTSPAVRRAAPSSRRNGSPSGWWTDLIPELNRQPGDIVVTKRTWGAFANTDLEAQLKARGVTQVVIAGVATGTGVESTARQAYEQGFNVTLALDAMTDRRAEAHDYSIRNVFPRLGETGTTPRDHRSSADKERLNALASLLAYFFGGAFLANAMPHFVSGMMGRPFQSPFAKPPGRASSSTVNVLWGFFNFVVGYLLVCRVGDFDLREHRRRRRAGAGAFSVRASVARGTSAASTAAISRSSHEAPFDGRLPLAARLQLPGLGGRRACVQRRHLDAAHRPGLARSHPAHPPQRDSAVGVVMALQFGPQLLLLPWTGFAADHFNQRKLLIATQATMGALALWCWAAHRHRRRAALARLRFRLSVRRARRLRCAGAPDLRRRTGRRCGPANAVALNSTSFNAARMIGPAVAGLVDRRDRHRLGLPDQRRLLRRGADLACVPAHRRASSECQGAPRQGSFTEGFRYVWGAPRPQGDPGHAVPDRHLRTELPDLHLDHGGQGLSCRRARIWPAVVDHGDRHGGGRAVGAPAATKPRFGLLLVGAAIFGLGCTLAAIAPSYWLFAGALVVIGVAALTFTNTTNSLMQLSTEPAMRGRVMALRVGIALEARRSARRSSAGSRTFRAALGARRRRGLGLCRGPRRRLRPGSPGAATFALTFRFVQFGGPCAD